MADESAIETLIESVASAPASVSGDTGSMTTRKLSDLIEADKYTSAKRSARSVCFGLRGIKCVPPGAV